MQESRVSSKTAIITGAGRRIGAAIARALHHEGYGVVVHYHQSEAAALALCAELNAVRADSAVGACCDLVLPEAAACLAKAAATLGGPLHVLVNNASQFRPSPFLTSTADEWDALMACNAKAPYFITQALTPLLQAAGGSVVNILDIHGEHPLKAHSLYSISKAALGMVTKTLAKELAPTIRVNGVAPGAIAWPEGENALSSAAKDKIISDILLKRHGEALDIAKAVVYLSQAATYMTGQIITVDGGRYL